MLRKTVSAILLFLLLASTLTVAFNIQPAKAEGGTIYIRADGSVDPPDAPILNVGNVYYTFTANIYDSIVVERSNIIIDGAGYTVQGSGSGDGFDIIGVDNVTIKNTNINGCHHGVHIELSSFNAISGNKITNCESGIILHKTSNYNDIFGNNITANIDGIEVVLYPTNNSISGNAIIANHGYGILLSSCSNNIVSGNNIARNNYGITLYSASNSSIAGNNITESTWYGIYFYYSSDNSIIGNNIANHQYGIVLDLSSNNNIICHNNFVNNAYYVYTDNSINIWDGGYPSGGNYWSDYTDVDLYSGPYQNETGSDGIWDHPYVIDENNKDQYPLLNPWVMLTDDFSTDSGMWSFVESVVNIDTGVKYPGSAYRDPANEYMVLTENRDYQAGVIWLNHDIFSPFTVEFKYKAGGGTGADGLVFMFYKEKNYDPYDGGGLGFVTPPGGSSAPTVVSGYGIEFDNWQNEAYNDPSGNHIALIIDHVNNHVKYANDSRTEDNQWHNVKIIVGGSSIEIYLDGGTVLTWEGTIDRTYGGLGFSATTASHNNWHIIDDVKITVNPWTPMHIWPMFQHDAQHTGRSSFVGPGISENPQITTLIGGSDTDWFYAPMIGSDGTLYFVGTVNGQEGIYAFTSDETQRWFYPSLLAYTHPLAITEDGSIFASIDVERYKNVSLVLLSSDGILRWKTFLVDWYPVGYPVADANGTIYFLASAYSGNFGRLIALNPDTGEFKWFYEIPGYQGQQTPAISKNGVIYFSQGNTTFAINTDGTEKWRISFPSSDPGGSIAKTPTISNDGTIYVVVSRLGVVDHPEVTLLYAINPDGTEKWSKYGSGFAGPVTIDFDGNIYTAGGGPDWTGTWRTVLYGFDSQGNYLENWPLELGPVGLPPLLVVDREGAIYGLFGEHTVKAFNRNGTQIWSLVLQEGRRYDLLSIGKDGALYVPGSKWLYAISKIPTPPIQAWSFDSDFQYNLDDDYATVEGTGHLTGKATLSAGNLSIEGQITLNGALPSGVPEVYLIATDGQDKELAKQAVDLSGFSYWQTAANTYNFTGQIPNVIQPINNGHYEAQALITYNAAKYEFFVNTASLINNHYFPLTSPPVDITPPVLIQDFIASDGEDSQTTLRWTNPSDADLAEIIILRKIEEYPSSHIDGELVYKSITPSPGVQVEFVDTTLVNGRIYGYAVFSRDSAGNWNDKVEEGRNADMASPVNPTNQRPSASFTYSPEQPKVGEPITFDASSSSDDGEIVLYEWDWDGDGRYDWSTSHPQVSFIYESSGTFQVGLRVTDNDGAIDTTSMQVVVAGLHFWEKVRDNFPWSDRVRQLTKEEYQYIKNQLYIFTFRDGALFNNFHNYYDREDEEIGSDLFWYTDWDLMDALNMEMDPEKSPGLTYGIYLLDALREMEKVQLTWTYGYQMKASKYFSDLLEANSKWTTERVSEELYSTSLEILNEIIGRVTPALHVGVSTMLLVADCLEFVVPIAKLTKLLYYNSLLRYLQDRYDGGMTHEEAWEELTLYPTQDYHIPTENPEKLAVIENYFKHLYDNYGSRLGDLDAFQREVKKDLRILVLNVLKAAHPVGHVIITPHSPVEVRVYDPYGNVTGIIDGQLREEILGSACDNETGMIFIYSASSGCYYEVVGKSDGIYGLDIANAENGNVTVFTATNIPVTSEAIHQYAIDWDALSRGEEGVTVQVDSDSDGIFEYTFTSDSELTRDEFIQQTTPTYTLTITAMVGGTTNPAPGTYTYIANSTVQVTAIPEANYIFDHWELDTVNVGSANPYTVLMDNNHTLKAVFTYSPPSPPLSASINPLSASMLVGQSVTFTSTVSGGYTPYSYQWYLNGNPVSGATSASWTFTPTTSGIYYVYLKVTDAKGNTAQSDTARIVVSTVPVGGYSIPIQLPTTAKPVTLHIALLTILTALFITIKRKAKRKR